MRILMAGDVVGKPGRRAVRELVPTLCRELEIDFVIANGENCAGGLGLTPNTADELFQAGVDVITTGNHAWAKKEIVPYLEGDYPIVRPMNYPPRAPGKGYCVHNGVLVAQVIGTVFLANAADPFEAIDSMLSQLREVPKVIIVDCHTEATSEIGALGWYLDGRVTAVLGTHTHVGTVDAKVLPKGTAFISDIGMVGPRDSVIGNATKEVLERFLTQERVPLKVATGPVVFSSVMLDVDEQTGFARSIQRVDREVS